MFKRPDDPPEHNYLYFLPTAALLALYAAGRYYSVPQIGTMAYLVSSAACIAAIGCLSNQSSARTGNALGMMGVAGGLAATTGMLSLSRELTVQLGGCLAAGLGVGWLLARRMQITVLPQMVAAFHSLVRRTHSPGPRRLHSWPSLRSVGQLVRGWKRATRRAAQLTSLPLRRSASRPSPRQWRTLSTCRAGRPPPRPARRRPLP